MKYDIKAIPTTYAGVNFRSRHEAKWAVFFDLCGWKWDYEPFDLDGWAPDFRLRTDAGPVLVEVKPSEIDLLTIDELAAVYQKALVHAFDKNVLLLGASPLDHTVGLAVGWPEPSDEFLHAIHVSDADDKWREAGNMVQWKPADPKQETVKEILRRAKVRAEQRG